MSIDRGMDKEDTVHIYNGILLNHLKRSNLNQITYNYTVEVRKRFKGLYLIDRVPDEPWTEVRDIVQETGIKTIHKGK